MEEPNVLLCLGCKIKIPWDRSPPIEGKRHWRCTECKDGEMRLRCGWPKADGSPCLRPAQPQMVADQPQYRCATKGHGGPGSDPPPLSQSKLRKLERLDAQLTEIRGCFPEPIPPKPARFIPEGMEEVYAYARIDPESQYQQIHEVALLAAHLDAMGKRIDTGESGATWRRLQTIGKKIRAQLDLFTEHSADYRKFSKAGNAKKADAAAERMQKANGKALSLVRSELLPVVEEGVGKEASAREWRQTMETRAKLQKVEQDRMGLLSTHTLAQAVQDTLDAVRRHASPEVMERIAEDLRAKREGRPILRASGNGKVIVQDQGR